MPRSDATRPRSSEAAVIMARRDYHALLYITLLRNYTAVTNLFLLLSIRKKSSEKIKEKKNEAKKCM